MTIFCAMNLSVLTLKNETERINKCLDGKILTGEERSYCTILTSDEEKSIVHFVNNKNRCMQPMSK